MFDKTLFARFRWNGKIDDFITKANSNYTFYPASGGKGCVAITSNPHVAGSVTMENVYCSTVENDNSNATLQGVCQYKGCKTKNGKSCQFPFR